MNEKKVLVIDDEDFIRELVKDFLEMEGILCDGAETAEKGMKLIEKNDYSLILLDRNLGTSKAEDNIVLIQKIKRKTPIMLLTGDADCDGEYLRQIGAVGIVFKPFQVTEFLEKIGKFL